ncbi:MAG TPA: RluA family pseudouridine synthase [bacterium]|nr:RluA family pseudouridine synthase [bacterium]
MPKYKIGTKYIANRLDKFLFEKIKKFSRSQIQKQIKDGLILVNNKIIQPHYFLKEKDVIEIKKSEIKKLGDSGSLQSPNRSDNVLNHQSGDQREQPIEIIFETPDYLVINKPEGLLVHPGNVHSDKTLIDWLIKKYPSIKKVFDKDNKIGKTRPGIVHRLDRDVSGLMVIAKTQPMFDYLKNQFKDRVIKKEYLALVHGEVSLDVGRIERALIRSKKTGLIAAQTEENSLGKEAITEFSVIQRYKKYTLLQIKLLTGRTHQIRVHLKSIGHSILGDKLYITRNIRLKAKKPTVNNIFLLSKKLGFYDLENNWQEFKIKEPKWWLEYLKILKS